MNGIVIIGHGNFGSGLNSTLELITDVVGGTPFKVACELNLEDDRIEVFYGTNMAMIIETCMNSQFEIELDNDSIAQIGKSNIDSFKLTKKNQTQEMAEEGI